MKKYSLKDMRERYDYQESDSILVGQKIYEFQKVTSTMDVVKELSSSSGVVVVSETQTQGKGRFEREWISQEKNDLLFSYILKIPQENIHTMLFKNSLSLLKTISELIDQRVFIKWPNDIYCENEKIAGILTKTELFSGNSELIVGIGLNVNSDKTYLLSKGLKATSLKFLTGKTFDKRKILYGFLNNLNKMLAKDFNENEVFFEWKNSLGILGKIINFRFIDNEKITLKAKVEDIDDIGRLIIKDSSGRKGFLSSEEITIVNKN
ncbi:MAG: biotin--[acetyl-CoA-carboxylase] ligase [Chloroflexi bacterium]|nr:biotin--[acetyl-CoA-carboxylase] ligase [Chloroflexota bacterium]|tara:strand:- start:910 stop:1704 length:795 start_codon:yes stop_codon:yes gene_type:complete